MSFETFKPEVWAQSIVDNIRLNSVAVALSNRNVVANKSGDKFHILGLNATSTQTQADGTDITYSEVTGTDTEFTYNLKKANGVLIYDTDAVQTDVNFQNAVIDDMGYQLTQDYDSAVLGDYATWTSYGTDEVVGTDAAGIPDLCADIALQMDEAGMRQDGRFLTVTPKLRKAFNIYMASRNTPLGDSVAQNGFIGSACGLQLYLSNNITTETGTSHCLAGVMGRGIATSEQIQPSSVEILRDKDAFADYLRSRLLAGYKTYKAAEVFNVNIAEEPLA